MQQNMMGQNIIITEPSKNLRALGRNALAGRWKQGILAMLVYTLCLNVPVVILDTIFGDGADANTFADITVGPTSTGYSSALDSVFLSDVYTILVAGALELGITLFFLAFFRKQAVNVMDVFLGFEKFGKALGLLLFQALFIVLWTLAFIIPGIIAAIRYSQAFYIMADNPDKSIRECMNESKMMMKGNKAKYFCLTFSFIGWMLLTILPLSAFFTVMMTVFGLPSTILMIIITLIALIFTVPVEVYMYATFTGFYEILAGHLIKETEPAPVMPDLMPSLGSDGKEAVPSSASNSEPIKKDDDNDDFFIPKQL